MNKSTQSAVTGEGNAPRNIEISEAHKPWKVAEIVRQRDELLAALYAAGVGFRALRDGLKPYKTVRAKPFADQAERLNENVCAAIAKAEGQDKGEQCAICGKDSWTCEHFDPREEAERNQ